MAVVSLLQQEKSSVLYAVRHLLMLLTQSNMICSLVWIWFFSQQIIYNTLVLQLFQLPFPQQDNSQATYAYKTYMATSQTLRVANSPLFLLANP